MAKWAKENNWRFWRDIAVIVAVFVPITIAASLFLASVGEPGALWLWRDIIGAM